MKTIDTIHVECACGERAKLPLELAGRRVRCTNCKAKIRVPGPRVDSERLDRTSDSRRQGRRSGSGSGSGSGSTRSGSKRSRPTRSGSGSARILKGRDCSADGGARP